MQRFYTAIIEKAKDGFGVFFPDLPGCVSFGKSVEEAAANAYTAAQAHVALSREYGDEIAPPRAPDEIPAEKGVKEKARLLIPVELSDEPVRVNISLPSAALEALDRTAKELSLSRSGAIAYLAMERRMMQDFTVNLEKRTATHKSGVEYGFYEYQNDQDWKEAAPYSAPNEDILFSGNTKLLRRAAKAAALAKGMKREKR